jgi:hypothetical protein
VGTREGVTRATRELQTQFAREVGEGAVFAESFQVEEAFDHVEEAVEIAEGRRDADCDDFWLAVDDCDRAADEVAAVGGLVEQLEEGFILVAEAQPLFAERQVEPQIRAVVEGAGAGQTIDPWADGGDGPGDAALADFQDGGDLELRLLIGDDAAVDVEFAEGGAVEVVAGHGRLRWVSGEWLVAGGQWPVAGGQWPVASRSIHTSTM